MLVDAIVDLEKRDACAPGGLEVSLRTMEVVKLRGQDHCLGRYLYNISGDGVTVLALARAARRRGHR